MASETNLPATVFVGGEGPRRRMRWFSPTTELELCGHGTLAGAHVLREHLGETSGQLAFSTRAADLLVRRSHGGGAIALPVDLPRPVEAPASLVGALGVEPVDVARSRLDLLVAVADPADVVAAQPDQALLLEIETRGVILTTPGGDGVDVTSRFFAPRAGIGEDPVTGSAHAARGPRSPAVRRGGRRRGGRARRR